MTVALLICLPLLGATGVKLIGKRNKTLRGVWVRGVCLLELAVSLLQLCLFFENGATEYSLKNVCQLGLTFKIDGFRAMYAVVAAFMWAMTGLFSHKYFAHYHNRTRYFCFNLLTLAGVMGLFLSDDFYTAFIFFEIMSMASYPWVAHDETPGAMRAAATYLGVAVLGGMVTLMGMFLLWNGTGSLAFEAVSGTKAYTAAALILFGFMAKAGAFPLHIWLPKAHPVAPAPASALLSGMLTKAGMFGILVISFNVFKGVYLYGCIMLAIALVTMLTGAVLGVLSNNLKRTLACSSMSQIGYILTGIAAAVLLGDEGALPAQGALTHMLNHSVLKLALFMAAGAVYMNTHKLELDDIRGFGRNKPLLHIVYLLGALGLAGVPGFNGYISKTMIHEGLVEWINESGSLAFRFCEWVFLFAAGLTTAYMLKTYITVFWCKNKNPETQAKYNAMRRGYLDMRSRIALMLSAALIPLIGLSTDAVKLYCENSLSFVGLEAFKQIEYFSLENLKGGAITLVIGTLVYLLIVLPGFDKKLAPRFDLEDSIYRPIFCRMLPDLLAGVCAVLNGFGDTSAKLFTVALAFVSRVCEAVTDTFAVVCKQFIFTRHSSETEYTGLKRAAANTQAAFARLKPRIKPDPREVRDLSYGSYFTNTVSFGLIICTAGIVLAFVYILTR